MTLTLAKTDETPRPIGCAALAAWLRVYADRADRGELRAAGIAVVTVERSVQTSWHDETGCGVEMIAASALLAHRVVKAVDDAGGDAWRR